MVALAGVQTARSFARSFVRSFARPFARLFARYVRQNDHEAGAPQHQRRYQLLVLDLLEYSLDVVVVTLVVVAAYFVHVFGDPSPQVDFELKESSGLAQFQGDSDSLLC